MTASTAKAKPVPILVKNALDDSLLVETYNLTKRYGHLTAVDNLTLSIRRGEVYGFVGLNGAGKTTTLRMLVGLIRPSAGMARVLDAKPGSPRGLRRVGALIESPAFYPYLSGRDNLRVIARRASVGAERVEEVLAQVGLALRARDKFKGYSLGMKQRLGVAAALVKDPDLLILDEPTNGLDPAGMADMRALIRNIGRGRRAVLFSSHQMGDVEQLCDRVGVVSRGRLVAEGTVDELRGAPGLLIRAYPLAAAHRCIDALAGVECVQMEDGALHVDIDPARAGALNRALVLAEVEVVELRRVERSLEQAFLTLTAGRSAGAESLRSGEQ